MHTISFDKNLFQLIQSVAKAIVRDYPHCVSDIRELYYTGYMALKQAEASYRTDGGAKFNTYASRCIYNEMLKEIGQVNNVVALPVKRRLECDFVEFDVNQSFETEDPFNPEPDYYEALYGALNELEPGDRELVQRRYGIDGDPCTLKQLGEARGVSLQAVHKKLHNIEQGLHDSLCRQCA